MKNIILVLAISLTSFNMGYAQKNAKKSARIEANKIAFITKSLQLTPDEAKVFWPVYDQYQIKVNEIKSNFRKEKKLSEMSDSELEKWIDNRLIMESVLLDEKKAYLAQLKNVIPIRKIGRLFKAEKRFRKKLLKEVRKRMKRK